ncbi:unnamed protein product [Danaus chrysippus]|uniref:(African queen) hypothetical protein n=1 Tax=Danaus chrysippus TaxID=151541 RepID=A0A8J2QG16_9NEOP|nr:unnamed protein product [Danaus chrysippus]
MAVKWRDLLYTLKRRRVFEPDQLDAGNLRRCLSVWDLTALGVGGSLGVGVYVLVGSVALRLAGPSIVLSFLIAAVAAVVAAMCFAELGSRVPKAGSAYIYTYVTVGEIVAFIIGWNMILELVFGTASVARGLSMYVDSVTNKSMSSWMESVVPIYSDYFSSYFDIFSFFVVVFLGVLLAVGVRESTFVNNMLTVVNMIVIVFIICAGAFKADFSNWNIPQSEVPPGCGVGGFFPYGVWGTLRGAAMCFYGFVGFDSISSTGEEVRDPRRAIPISIMGTQVIVFLAYAGVSIVVTMMMPYYLQETVASVATSFTYVGWDWARWFVTAGAVVGISASLYGSMFPLPRLLYSMASDGLLFHWLSKVTSKRKSPTVATILSTVVIALLAALLELNDLILMMCIGTLLSYTIVASCVILLRYRANTPSHELPAKHVVNIGRRLPTKTTSNIVVILLLLFICACVSSAVVVTHVFEPLVGACTIHAAGLLLLVAMALQPQNEEDLTFQCPLVPMIPCISIYVNIHLMILIKLQTWIRCLCWIAIGIPVYIFCVCCYKQKVENYTENNANSPQANGKAPVQIFVVSPTPPGTMGRSNQGGGYDHDDDIRVDLKQNIIHIKEPVITEEIIVQHAYIGDNEEKEAKIIDLLDQVLQAEEDSYEEIISLKEHKEEPQEEVTTPEMKTHRKSLSEISDAGSDVSTQVLSKYDVIAQVHREDLPKLTEEEEKSDKETESSDNEIPENEDLNCNGSDTNSRTDESGYSDTLDKTVLGESIEDLKEAEEIPNIPVPPPLDENFFASPTFKKSYTISVRPPKRQIEQEDNKPRESVDSNHSYDDAPMVFGSDKQMNFMSKLENIFQSKMANDNEEDPHRKRSNSTGNVVDSPNLQPIRPVLFLDLKKEIVSREVAQNLRHVDTEDKKESSEEEEKDVSMSREDLKSKLENIFAVGGPQLIKSRLMKSNPPTPEEAYHTDGSSTESIPKVPTKEKNDTLKRQKTKFGEVLNSLRMMNNDDKV